MSRLKNEEVFPSRKNLADRKFPFPQQGPPPRGVSAGTPGPLPDDCEEFTMVFFRVLRRLFPYMVFFFVSEVLPPTPHAPPVSLMKVPFSPMVGTPPPFPRGTEPPPLFSVPNVQGFGRLGASASRGLCFPLPRTKAVLQSSPFLFS